jgi:TolA-binding protein
MTLEVVLALAQGMMALLLSLAGWVLRNALGQARETEKALADVRERLVRVESTLDAVTRLEDKLDSLTETVQQLRQDVVRRSSFTR